MITHSFTLRRFAPLLLLAVLTLAPFPAPAEQGAGQGPAHGLLWRIEGAGSRPSYLFGTMHSDDARVTRLPYEVTNALLGARSVTLELLPNMETQLASAQAMVYKDGTKLSKVLGSSLYARTRKAATRLGLPEQALESMKPWAIMVALSIPPPTTGEFMDLLIYQKAQKAGKQTHALETYQEQLGVFDSLSISDQKRLLKNTLDDQPKLSAYFGKLINAYRARDLAAMNRLSDESISGTGAAGERLMEELVVKRNRRMAERMQPRLKEGGAFIAVGALHLAGTEGLVRLLEARGLKLSKIY